MVKFWSWIVKKTQIVICISISKHFEAIGDVICTVNQGHRFCRLRWTLSKAVVCNTWQDLWKVVETICNIILITGALSYEVWEPGKIFGTIWAKKILVNKCPTTSSGDQIWTWILSIHYSIRVINNVIRRNLCDKHPHFCKGRTVNSLVEPRSIKEIYVFHMHRRYNPDATLWGWTSTSAEG